MDGCFIWEGEIVNVGCSTAVILPLRGGIVTGKRQCVALVHMPRSIRGPDQQATSRRSE